MKNSKAIEEAAAFHGAIYSIANGYAVVLANVSRENAALAQQTTMQLEKINELGSSMEQMRVIYEEAAKAKDRVVADAHLAVEDLKKQRDDLQESLAIGKGQYDEMKSLHDNARELVTPRRKSL